MSRRSVQLGSGCAPSLLVGVVLAGCSVSPDAGNPDTVGAMAPPPINSRVTAPRDPRVTAFDLHRDGGSSTPDGGWLDAGSDDAAVADPVSQPAADAGQSAVSARLDAVVASFNASVELECACLWSAPGYRYDSQATCVAVGKLDAASASCVRSQLIDAPGDVLDCKLDAERTFRACLADGCSETAALACVEAWAEADDACDPSLAAAVYDACLASGA